MVCKPTWGWWESPAEKALGLGGKRDRTASPTSGRLPSVYSRRGAMPFLLAAPRSGGVQGKD